MASKSVPLIRKTILVVECNQGLLALPRYLLRDLGYRVLEGSHGLEAILIVRQSPDSIDLPITELYLPYMNGIESAARVKKCSIDRHSKIPIQSSVRPVPAEVPRKLTSPYRKGVSVC
jgi:CheY-like chemotaxis protein